MRKPVRKAAPEGRRKLRGIEAPPRAGWQLHSPERRATRRGTRRNAPSVTKREHSVRESLRTVSSLFLIVLFPWSAVRNRRTHQYPSSRVGANGRRAGTVAARARP